MICISTKCYSVLRSKRMRWARHVVRIWKRRGTHTVLVGNIAHVEDLDVFGKIILKWTAEKGWGVDRIALVQGREKWRSVVNAVINLRVPQE